MTEESGTTLTVTRIKAPGLTIDMCRQFYEPDILHENMHLLDSKMTCHKLQDDLGEGRFGMYQHVKTPIVASNRCTFMSVQQLNLDSGGFVNMNTSKGMQAIEQANTALIAKDVLSHCHIVYDKYEPCDDGVYLTAVLCVDVRGSLPGMIKKQIAKD